MSVRAIATHLLQFVLCVGRVTTINACIEVECKVVVAYSVFGTEEYSSEQ